MRRSNILDQQPEQLLYKLLRDARQERVLCSRRCTSTMHTYNALFRSSFFQCCSVQEPWNKPSVPKHPLSQLTRPPTRPHCPCAPRTPYLSSIHTVPEQGQSKTSSQRSHQSSDNQAVQCFIVPDPACASPCSTNAGSQSPVRLTQGWSITP